MILRLRNKFMFKIISKILIIALAVIGASHFIPGISVNNYLTAILFALILGIINVLVRPLAMLLSLPIRLLTFGLFTLIINALMFWLASVLVSGMNIDSFFSAFLGALIVGVVSWAVNLILKENKKD